jgi:hypothetical protein
MFPPDCPGCKNQLVYLYDWLLAHDNRLKIGLFSSFRDQVVSTVVGMSGADNQSILMETTNKISQDHTDTFKRFFIKGESHTIGDYYWSVNHIILWDWMTYLVNDDPRWKENLE